MRLVTGILIIFSGLYTGYKIYDLWSFNQEQKSQHISHGLNSCSKVTTVMDSILAQVVHETESIAKDFAENSFAEKEIYEILKEGTIKNPAIMGMLSAYEPNQFSADRRLFAPFYIVDDDDFIFIEEFYDYTDTTLDKSDWYTDVRDQGKQWTEPSFAGAAQRLVADYGVPFYQKNQVSGDPEVAGTITSTITLKSLNNLLNALSLGNTGYAFAISKKGKYLGHPNQDYLKEGRTITEVAEAQNDPSFKNLAKEMLEGEEGFGTYTNTVTGQESWLFYSPIENTGWKVGVVMIKDELLAETHVTNGKKVEIALFSALTILLIAILFSGVFRGKEDVLWNLSITLGILILLNIAFIWYLEIKHASHIHRPENILIADYTGLNTFLTSLNEKAASANEPPPITIPTGVIVEEVEFVSGYNVNVSGYVWQNYDHDLKGKILEGFTFPQAAPDAEMVHIEEAYRYEMRGYDLLGYEFRVMLRLDFDYSKYPFDRKEINLQLRPADLSQNIVLTPDFNAYQTLNPSSLPGAEKDLVLPGWVVKSSYFDYRPKHYSANFGFEELTRKYQVPEFHFNILLNRIILSPFIATVIPLMVVAIMLFGVVFSTTKNSKKNVLAGFSTFGVVQTCAAFFFVIILAHTDLRRGMDTEEITYIEYFYFIMYLILLLVVFDVIIFSNSDKKTVFDYKDNLLMKLFYWPLLLGICLVITLLKFY